MNTIGNYAPDFEIPGIDKEVYHLGSYLRKFTAIAVVFMGDVPEVAQYIDCLKQIQIDFSEQNFTVMGIDCNFCTKPIAESLETMQNFATTQGLNFPYLRDSTQDVARSFNANILPTAYLLDSNAVIRYQGRIDDRDMSSDQIKNNYLRDCITTMLAGEEIAKDYIAPLGAEITWRPK